MKFVSLLFCSKRQMDSYSDASDHTGSNENGTKMRFVSSYVLNTIQWKNFKGAAP